MITGFVLAMMLVIEYLNVSLRRRSRDLRVQGLGRQYLIAAFLGALPGCLGPWAIVTMYGHGLMSLGALVAVMIATSGDEAFVMLTVAPHVALPLFGVLALCGVAAGALTDLLLRGSKIVQGGECAQLQFHPEAEDGAMSPAIVWGRWRRVSGVRLLLTLVFLAVVAGTVSGVIAPPEWNWIRVTLLLTSGFGLFVVATVSQHFLEDHLWRHVLRRHAPRVFLWTLAAMAATEVIVNYLKLDTMSLQGKWIMLAAACLVGIIPQSGPHLLFFTLYVHGAAPLSILLANSIVQDGHGMLPLLAESRRVFLITKFLNIVVGLLAGGLVLAAGH